MIPDDEAEVPSAEDLAEQFSGAPDDDPSPDEPPTQEQLLRLWHGTEPEERRQRLRNAAIGEVATRAWSVLVAGLHEQGIELGTEPVILGDGVLVTESGEWSRDPEAPVDARVAQVKALEALMARDGLSTAAVAERLGVSVSAVRSWLAGRALPGIASQQALQELSDASRRERRRRPGRR